MNNNQFLATKLPQRPLTPTRLIIATALFLAATGNVQFFRQLTAVYPWGLENFPFIVSVGVLLACVLMFLLSILSAVLTARIVASLFILLAAAIGFFSDQFGATVDTVMIQNIAQADTEEARALLTGSFILRLLLLGIAPVVLLWALPMDRGSYRSEFIKGIQIAVVALIITAICGYNFSAKYAGFLRDHKSLHYYTNPTFTLYSLSQLGAPGRTNTASTTPIQGGTDGRPPLEEPNY